jgi:hypothetical protein
MIKKSTKLSILIAISFGLIFTSSTATLVHITHAQTNKTSAIMDSATVKNDTSGGK